MGQCCPDKDETSLEGSVAREKEDKVKPLLKTSDNYQSTGISKHNSEDMKQEDGYKSPENSPDAETNPSDLCLNKATGQRCWPLPGENVLDLDGKCDLVRDLEVLKDRFGDKYKERLVQTWQNLDEKSKKGKKGNGNGKSNSDPNSISVMQFNMLSDSLSTGYEIEDYEKTLLGVDKDCLRWTYRGLRIVELLCEFECDVICVEECDQTEFLMSYLSKLGYAYYTQCKETSPTVHIAKTIIKERVETGQVDKDYAVNKDGLLVAFKQDKFVLASDPQHVVDTENKAKATALALHLRCKTEDRNEFLLVCTHLKSTKTEEGENKRVNQVHSLFNGLIKNDDELPVLMCSDLNANPIINKKGYKPLCYEKLRNEIGFSSAYAIANNGEEPEYTTWKYREHGTDKHTIDYIFMSPKVWSVDAVLSIPEGDPRSKALIPNWHYPSDHFAIGAQISWV